MSNDCPECNGKGACRVKGVGLLSCPTCKGTGYYGECPECSGTGVADERHRGCLICEGTGTISERKNAKVKIEDKAQDRLTKCIDKVRGIMPKIGIDNLGGVMERIRNEQLAEQAIIMYRILSGEADCVECFDTGIIKPHVTQNVEEGVLVGVLYCGCPAGIKKKNVDTQVRVN